MAHHAYLYAGDAEAGIAEARRYASSVADTTVFEYQLLSVDDARRIASFAAQAPSHGTEKVLILSAGRIFHEAQNALLKLFEEPVEGTTLILVVPVEGMLLPTLRSRLITLSRDEEGVPARTLPFLGASADEREKIVAKLIARSKSDKDEEKQAARLEAVTLHAAITHAAHQARLHASGKDAEDLDLLLRDLDRFSPMLHERAAPLKLIFEHLLLVLPKSLGK